ncbi:MAG: arylesterase [Candidatus Paceibacterota bacterium]
MKPINKIIILVVILLAGAFYLLSGLSNDKVISDIKPKASMEDKVKIVAFGDSLTAGLGLPISDSYPAQLETALTAKQLAVTVINSGVSGETTKGNLERASFIRSQNPDIVLLGIGGNDALRLLPISETRKNIDETIGILKGGVNPPVVILLQMQAPLNAGLGYKNEFDSIYEELAEKHNILLVPFLTAEIFLDNANKLSDGIHLNQVGYGKVVDQYLMPVVEEVIIKLIGK